jgi:PAS domain
MKHSCFALLETAVATDAMGRIVFLNDAARELFGSHGAEIHDSVRVLNLNEAGTYVPAS